MEFEKSYTAEDLVLIVAKLRNKDGGCPWDMAQTHSSIRKNFIEETYEAVDAIDANDTAGLQEELGDVLLQVALHAQMEAEQGNFTFNDVCDGICKKLILRHPHIFGDTTVGDVADVLHNWERIKKKEKGYNTATNSIAAVPKALPALMRASKIQKRAADAGFDYENAKQAIGQLKSEIEELEAALEQNGSVPEELGDILFSAVNAARLLGFDSEEVLTAASEKFVGRFAKVEAMAAAQGAALSALNLDELTALWNAAKAQQ